MFCSRDQSGRPSTSGKTWAFRCSPPYLWSEEPGDSAVRRAGSSSRYWPAGVPRSWAHTATYDYAVTRDGSPWYSILRFEAPDDERDALLSAGERTKSFRPARAHELGGWRWGLPSDSNRIWYRWPDWFDARQQGLRLYLVEGERDVQTAYTQTSGAAFTTAAGGVAGLEAFLREPAYAAAVKLAGASGINVLDVVLDRDANGAGDRVRELVEQYLHEPGHVRAARYWHAHPSIDADGADLTDHLTAGFDLSQLDPA